MNPSSQAQTGTRERILEYLEENRTATVVALSRAWGLTRADIRYHLNRLIEEGLVERAESAGQSARGRPSILYKRSAMSARDNFARLSCALLEVLLDSLAEDATDEALRRLAGKLAGNVNTSSARVTSARFNQAVEVLNAQAYRARWEASPAGPRFLLRACPYAALVEQRPELCRIDMFLLEALTGLPLKQATRMRSAPGSPPACVFLPR